MHRRSLNALGLLAAAWLLGAASASAQSYFYLTPPCAPGLCGASRLGIATTRPPGILTDEQDITAYVDATPLLQTSSEHIAISTFARGEPVDQYGAFVPDASNGGIGIALGRLDHADHANCPEDPFDSKVEFAIETFGWRDILASRILNCVSFDKSALNGVGWLSISLSVQCTGTTCKATASAWTASTYIFLGSVSNTGISLANPTTTRNSWYSVTNFANEPITHGAGFQVQADNYWIIQ